MDGMTMMLKSLGFDPEKLKQQIDETVKGFQMLIENYKGHMDSRLNVIEGKLDYLAQKTDGFEACGKGANQEELEKKLSVRGHLMGAYEDGE